jgi:hypothetical protein
MRRAVIVLGTTAAGLAALLSFKSHSLAAPVPPASTPAPSTGSPQAMASGTGSSSTGSTAGKAASATSKASATTPAATRTVVGTVANTQYGPMQVQVTLAGTKITNVTVLQRTDDGTACGTGRGRLRPMSMDGVSPGCAWPRCA